MRRATGRCRGGTGTWPTTTRTASASVPSPDRRRWSLPGTAGPRPSTGALARRGSAPHPSRSDLSARHTRAIEPRWPPEVQRWGRSGITAGSGQIPFPGDVRALVRLGPRDLGVRRDEARRALILALAPSDASLLACGDLPLPQVPALALPVGLRHVSPYALVGGRCRVGEVCSQQVAASLYADSMVEQPR